MPLRRSWISTAKSEEQMKKPCFSFILLLSLILFSYPEYPVIRANFSSFFLILLFVRVFFLTFLSCLSVLISARFTEMKKSFIVAVYPTGKCAMKRFFLAIVIPLLLLTTPASADTKKYRILSVDGGGIRGVIAAQILVMLEKENPGFLENIDLFAGTSTGSIIAGFLAAGKSPQDLLDIYTTYGSQIFVPAHKDDLLHLHAKYSTEKLTELMQKIGPPGNPTLSQLKKKVVIPSVKLNNEQTGSWDPVTFDNFEYSDLPLLDAMLRSSAAPTYFPSYQGYVDGGMAATNPSMIAIAAAVDVKKGGKQPEQIHMLSLGTGTPLSGLSLRATWTGALPNGLVLTLYMTKIPANF